MISCRRSVRSYLPEVVSKDTLAAIEAFIAQVRPLDPDIRVKAMILGRDEVTTLQKWDTPHFLAIFSEDKPGWRENIGFMFQQVDLYFQSIGLGSCWVGLGWPTADEQTPAAMRFGILMPFGHPKEDVPERKDISEFKRKTLAEIADAEDQRLECVRIAPSATNSQPWYFTHDGDVLHVYREELGLIKQRTHGKFNPMDMGIALAHLYVTYGERFSFWREEQPPELEGYIYTGTIRIRD